MPILNLTRRSFAVLARLVAPACGLAFALPPASAADAGRRRFDIPADDAVPALRSFAAQSGRQVIYSGDAVASVKTEPVRGEFTPRDALHRMLTRTLLVVKEDTKTGALAVMPAAKANGSNGSASLTQRMTPLPPKKKLKL